MSLVIRRATSTDAEIIHGLIVELSEYEKLRHECFSDPATLVQHLFGDRPYAEVRVAEWDGEVVAMALFFHTFSTFECAPSLYLEDLYVQVSHRGRGIGKAMLKELARLAVERECKRLEWAVLDWNEPAIEFYRALGARGMPEWITFRLDGEALARVASVE